MKEYRTIQGDMWDSIAYQQLGNICYTDELIMANPEYCNLFVFPAGIVLKIPEVSIPEDNTLPPWKRVNT